MVEATHQDMPIAAAAAGRRATNSQLVGVIAGSALEIYDFVTYSFFAIQIGQTFFPSHDPKISLLASLATFGAGFLTRPIGAIVLGGLGDRVGRKPAMLLSFALMGAALVGLALTPSFKAIGVAAPVLAVMFRLLQGFSLGGEIGPSTAFLFEAAPVNRRGSYVAFQTMGQDSAVLVAGLIGFGLATVMGAEALRDYGWRIALLAGAAIVPFGLVLRARLTETLRPDEPAPVPDPAGRKRLPPHFRVAVLGLMMMAAATTVNYVLEYMATYAAGTLHMSTRTAFGATVVLGLTNVCFDHVGGWLCDRYGRRPVLVLSWIILLLLIMPCFYAVSHFHNALALFGAVAVISVPQSLAGAPMITSITESLPARTRSGVLALVYALSVAIFGGTAQFNVAWLTGVTHSPLAPGWYMAAGVSIGLIGSLLMRETAPFKQGGL